MKTQKVLIFDSGTLINLSMNGLLYVVEELRNHTNVRFAITKDVKSEVIDRPLGIPRFELGAIRVKHLLDSNILELPTAFQVNEKELNEKTQQFMNLANHSVESHGVWVNIVSNAEMSCLALSSILSKKKMQTMIAIDERTTRILAEKPNALKDLMSSKLHVNVTIQKDNFNEFKEFQFLRSTELVYVAFKKGLIKISDPRALEAALFATKFKGAAVSFEEINSLKKL